MNKDPSKKKSKYYGVSWHWTKDKGKWQVTRNYTPLKKADGTYKFYDNKLPRKGPKKEYKSSIKAYNGCFENEEEAARASDELYRKLHKQGLRIWCFKRLNFPNEEDKRRQSSMKAGETIVDKDGVRYQRVAKHKYMFFDRNCQRWVAEIKRYGIRASSTDEDECYKDFVYKALKAGIDPTTGKSTMNEAEKARAEEEKVKEALKNFPNTGGKKSRNRKRRKITGQKTKRKRVKREPFFTISSTGRLIDDSDEPWTPGCEKFTIPPPMLDRSKNLKRKVYRKRKEKPWKTPPALACAVLAVNVIDSPNRISVKGEVKRLPLQSPHRFVDAKILPSDLNKRALELKRLRSPARLRNPDKKPPALRSTGSAQVGNVKGQLITPKPLKRSAVAYNHAIMKAPPIKRSRTPRTIVKVEVKVEAGVKIEQGVKVETGVKLEQGVTVPTSSQTRSASQTTKKEEWSPKIPEQLRLSQLSQNLSCSQSSSVNIAPSPVMTQSTLSQASTGSTKSFANVTDGLCSQISVGVSDSEEMEDMSVDGWGLSGIPFQLPCSGELSNIPPLPETCDPLEEEYEQIGEEIQMLEFFNP